MLFANDARTAQAQTELRAIVTRAESLAGEQALHSAMAFHESAWSTVIGLPDDAGDDVLTAANVVESYALESLALVRCASAEGFQSNRAYVSVFLSWREEQPSVDDGYGALAIVISTELGAAKTL